MRRLLLLSQSVIMSVLRSKRISIVLIASLFAVGVFYTCEITVPGIVFTFSSSSTIRSKPWTNRTGINVLSSPAEIETDTISVNNFVEEKSKAPQNLGSTTKQVGAFEEENSKQGPQTPGAATQQDKTAGQNSNALQNLKSVTEQDRKSIYCTWSPRDDTECIRTASPAIASSNSHTRRRRWLFLGDSTMYQMVNHGGLGGQMTRTAVKALQASCPKLVCKSARAGRCNTNDIFHMPRSKEWIRPSASEGPMMHGLQNPFCQDCMGCNSNFLECTVSDTQATAITTSSSSPLCSLNNNTQVDLSHGGYVSVEFARDVEVQSDLYTTTQENMIHYLKSSWNSERLVQEFGRPVCVVSTGIHDVTIPNMTMPIYLENVEWYLNLLNGQCDHVVWLSNTCPLTKDYAQQKSQTALWNLAVLEILKGDAFVEKSTFIDVFNASIRWPHGDNIHMDGSWYSSLNSLFRKLVQNA
eukprot:Plantae.Rhodophyta-Palmaria_palmata.ctg1547.p1 GENE.Plantae.Rhodophyta-Palmaria_palmata.ctg1547~~Plantae.Rhodophyta-Palmaria_palmata.ctg1547.p1  ORF type:complete len:469 (-),score=28.09 Plantae.Rhodophyta-Palmaria_palmata.ctg1547:282-1688(-)